MTTCACWPFLVFVSPFFYSLLLINMNQCSTTFMLSPILCSLQWILLISTHLSTIPQSSIAAVRFAMVYFWFKLTFTLLNTFLLIPDDRLRMPVLRSPCVVHPSDGQKVQLNLKIFFISFESKLFVNLRPSLQVSKAIGCRGSMARFAPQWAGSGVAVESLICGAELG